MFYRQTFKQWGGVRKKNNGRKLDGRTYDQYPERARADVPDRASCMAFAENVVRSVQEMIQRKTLVPITA